MAIGIEAGVASPPPLPLDGRVAIVTGGSRAPLGARLVVNYASSSAHADAVAAELNSSVSEPSAPPRAIAVRTDISDPDQVKHLFDEAERAFGSPALVFVNCAGAMDPKYPSVADTKVEDWDSIFKVNARGAFLGCREAANRLRRGGGGRIVMVTKSVVGSLFPGYSAYAVSKAAVETMTKITAKELKGTGITANCVAPGPVATELFFSGKTEETVKRMVDACPLGRLAEGKDVAEVVGFLASDAGEWVNGQ
ncbi:hypothetical protein EUGRSUZ_A02089, partial [Eucalyptus grandis]